MAHKATHARARVTNDPSVPRNIWYSRFRLRGISHKFFPKTFLPPLYSICVVALLSTTRKDARYFFFRAQVLTPSSEYPRALEDEDEEVEE